MPLCRTFPFQGLTHRYLKTTQACFDPLELFFFDHAIELCYQLRSSIADEIGGVGIQAHLPDIKNEHLELG